MPVVASYAVPRSNRQPQIVAQRGWSWGHGRSHRRARQKNMATATPVKKAQVSRCEAAPPATSRRTLRPGCLRAGTLLAARIAPARSNASAAPEYLISESKIINRINAMPIHLPAVCAIVKRGARIAGGSGTGGTTMTEMRTRPRFRPLAIGLFGALLPLALSSTAQTPAPPPLHCSRPCGAVAHRTAALSHLAAGQPGVGTCCRFRCGGI